MRNVLRSSGVFICAALLCSLVGAQRSAPRRPGGKPSPQPIQVLDENGLRLGITITSFPITTAVVGESYQYQVVVTDNCSGTQIYGYVLVAGPSGLSLNAGTGLMSWVPLPGDVGFHDVAVRITTSGGSLCPSSPRDVQSFRIEVVQPPSDPADDPSPPDPTGSFFDETSFLWDGSSGIQTGVAPTTIDPDRVAVLRGFAFDRDSGLPLSGVRMTILDHPEFGETLTRVDGGFDMAVNGGVALTISYLRGGFLESQRTTDVPVNTYVCIDDVFLVVLDENVSEVLLGQNPGVEVAQGSVESDADGTRQGTVIFPSGISAELESEGGTAPVIRINVRVTEYSVGTNGDESLPGSLPEGMGYTYVAELSADEVAEADASRIQFSSAFPMYVENFLGFDVGTKVSAAFYDPELGVWVPSPLAGAHTGPDRPLHGLDLCPARGDDRRHRDGSRSGRAALRR